MELWLISYLLSTQCISDHVVVYAHKVHIQSIPLNHDSEASTIVYDPDSLPGTAVNHFRSSSQSQSGSDVSSPDCTSMYDPNDDSPVERAALESLYHQLQGPGWYYPDNWLNNTVSICCWMGITCASSTTVTSAVESTVTVPSNTHQHQQPHQTQYVSHINLGNKRLNGSIEHFPFDTFTSLARLQLDFNDLHGRFPLSVFRVPKLTQLDLAHCQLFGDLPSNGWANLTVLASVTLNDNLFSGQIPASMGSVSALQYLDLSHNKLDSPIPETFAKLSQLSVLTLRDNKLYGGLPSFIGDLPLTALDIQGCGIGGSLPDTLVQLHSMTYMDVASNSLKGDVAKLLSPKADMMFISAAYNQLTGTVPQLPLCNSLQASQIMFSNNELDGFPECVWNLPHVTLLDFADNGISKALPERINATKLVMLSMHNNHFYGRFPTGWGAFQFLSSVDFSNNLVSGELPVDACDAPYIDTLLLTHNSLQGRIPPRCITNEQLRNLDLSKNSLIGEIPPILTDISPLSTLSLHHNHLSGAIPPSIAKLSNLKILYLFRNKLSGTLPEGIGQMKKLEIVGLQHNSISGSIPDVFGSLTSLKNLGLSDNLFSGALPDSLSSLPSLQRMDLSNNHINGTLPLWVSHLTTVQLSNNELTLPPCARKQADTDVYSCENSFLQTPASVISLLDLSFNPLHVPLSHITALFGRAPIVDLNLSGCGISSSLLLDLVNFCYQTGTSTLCLRDPLLFPELRNLDVSSNDGITWTDWGTEYLPPPLPFALVQLDIHLTNAFLDRQQTERIRKMPFSLTASRDAVQLNLACPALSVQNFLSFDVTILADPLRYNYTSCVCEENTRLDTHGGRCVPCVAGLVCTAHILAVPQDDASLVKVAHVMHTVPGYFPVLRSTGAYAFATLPVTPDETDMIAKELLPIPCHNRARCGVGLEVEPFPRTESEFEFQFACAPGTDSTSLMCSKCLDTHFDFHGMCFECTGVISGVSFVVSFLVLSAAFWFFWRANWRDSSAITSIVIFYLQLTPGLQRQAHFTGANDSNNSNMVFAVASWITQATYFSPSGWECAFSSDVRASYPQFWVSILSVPCVVITCLIIYSAKRVWSRFAGSFLSITPEYYEQRRLHVIGRIQFFLFLMWFPVAQSVLSIFNCQTIPGLYPSASSSGTYLDVAPWISCDSNAYDAMFAAALVYLLLFVIPYPAYLSWMLYRHAHELGKEHMISRFGFLYSAYRPLVRVHKDNRDWRWVWELVVNGMRKILLAVALVCIRYGSQSTPSLVLFVLFAALVLHVRVRPYRLVRDNMLETFFLGLAAAVYMIDVLLQSDPTAQSGNTATITTTPMQSVVRVSWLIGQATAVVVLVLRAAVPAARQLHRRLGNRGDGMDDQALAGSEELMPWQESSSHRAHGDGISMALSTPFLAESPPRDDDAQPVDRPYFVM
jgi:Leucine-rich repeat (LRR) protein